MTLSPLLHGAYDLHVHCGPDVVPRAADVLAVAADARRAGMAGVPVGRIGLVVFAAAIAIGHISMTRRRASDSL